MRKEWSKYIIIIMAGILIVITLLLVIIFFRQQTSPIQTSPNTPITTITPTQPVFPYYGPSGAATPEKNNPSAPLITQGGALTPTPTVLMNKEGNKPVLSKDDIFAEENILSLLPDGQASGTVYQSETVKIDYDSDSDKFIAEILSVDVAQAKSEAVSWFEYHGMSQQGICNLPVEFTLSPQVNQTLADNHVTFSPLPDMCPPTKSTVLGATSTGATVNLVVRPIKPDNWVLNIAHAAAIGGASNGGTTGGGGISAGYVAPSTDTCGGKYNLSAYPYKNPLNKNFGDPTCNFNKDKLAQLIKSKDPQNLHIWFDIIAKGESNYIPTSWAGPPVLNTPDPLGGWGLYAMGSSNPPGQPANVPDHSSHSPLNRGDLNWELQTANAIDYNNKVIHQSFCYWSTAIAAGVAHGC